MQEIFLIFWFGLVWFGLAWPGLAWPASAWLCYIQSTKHNTTQRNAPLYVRRPLSLGWKFGFAPQLVAFCVHVSVCVYEPVLCFSPCPCVWYLQSFFQRV